MATADEPDARAAPLTHPGLVRAILEEPDLDEHSLIYADWFEEQGDRPRAELIRIQVAKERILRRLDQLLYGPDRLDWLALDRDECALLAEHNERLCGEVPAPNRAMGWTWHDHFEGGLVRTARIHNLEAFANRPPWTFADQPVRALRIDDFPFAMEDFLGWFPGGRETDRPDREPLRAVEGLAFVRSLRIHPLLLNILLVPDHWDRLTHLELTWGQGMPSGLRGIMWGSGGLGRRSEPILRQLRSIRLRWVGQHSPRDSATSMLRTLTRTSIFDQAPSVETIVVESFPNLTGATIASCPSCRVVGIIDGSLDDQAIARLTEGSALAGLETLNLASNQIGDLGAEALAASPNLAGLVRLELRGNRIGDRGARALARSPHLGRLEYLGLAHNRIERLGADALGRAPGLGRIVEFDLSQNPVPIPVLRALRERVGDRVRSTSLGLGGDRP